MTIFFIIFFILWVLLCAKLAKSERLVQQQYRLIDDMQAEIDGLRSVLHQNNMQDIEYLLESIEDKMEEE